MKTKSLLTLILFGVLVFGVTSCEEKDNPSSSDTGNIGTSDSTGTIDSTDTADSTNTTESSNESTDTSTSDPGVNPIAAYMKTIDVDNSDGLKILNFTDIQLHDGKDPSVALKIIDDLVKRENPDLITVLGDTIDDSDFYEAKVNCVTIINAIDSYDIPWAPVFGNHDHTEYHYGNTKKDIGCDVRLAGLFHDAENCLFTDGPSYLQGIGNYGVFIRDKDNGNHLQTCIFLDSMLSGLQDNQADYLKALVGYAKELNNGYNVNSTLFTHIPLPEYGDALQGMKDSEYANVDGAYNRVPCDIENGSRATFPAMKEVGTDLVVCGHDHENSYSTVYDGVRLTYSMKSSDSDDEYSNYCRLGGSVVKVENGKKELYFTSVNIPYHFSGTSSNKAGKDFEPEVLPQWRYSGAKLCFDVTIPSSGTMYFNICGTNYERIEDSQSGINPSGLWNRLTVQINLNASNKQVSEGSLTQIEGNKYRYELDLAHVGLNTGAGETAYGDETARMIYFNGVIGEFDVENLHFEYEKITETNQLDLADAEIILGQQFYTGKRVKPQPVVKLGGKTLMIINDIKFNYENNIEKGTAKLKVTPSGKGAHKYKGYKEIEFEIVDNPDEDTMPGHENAILVDETAFSTPKFSGGENWYGAGKSLHFEVKRLANGKIKTGETARFSIHGKNPDGNEGANSDWNRLSSIYLLDFETHTVHRTNGTTPIGSFTEMQDGWWSVTIPFIDFALNESGEGATGKSSETATFLYMDNIQRSFKFDNICVL